MTLSDKKRNSKLAKIYFWQFAFLFFLLIPFNAFAEKESVTFTITPPLIKNNVSPGQNWHSAVRVVNNNSRDMEVYARVMDFKGGGETGNVQLLKEQEMENGENFLLSKWILIDPGPYKLPAFGSKDIPFAVNVPEDAEPGGHYAAVLIGTQPPDNSERGSMLKVSSLIGSLLLLKVQGDIEERGWIREFSTEKRIYTEPNVNFKIRFENAGNVHILPRGEIRITDMFGEEKESIKINHASEFNNVLPGDIRKWEFSWSDKKNIFEMGRYKAEAIMVYGEQARETITRTTYFWIIYLKPLIAAASGLLLFILLLILFIRSYVRRSLAKTQAQIQAVSGSTAAQTPRPVKRKKISIEEGDSFKRTMPKKQKPKKPEPAEKKVEKTIKKKNSGPVDLRYKK